VGGVVLPLVMAGALALVAGTGAVLRAGRPGRRARTGTEGAGGAGPAPSAERVPAMRRGIG
ncbi:hypothetical protein AB0J52_31515, partial [Spirillospora sp. NPDC049652]